MKLPFGLGQGFLQETIDKLTQPKVDEEKFHQEMKAGVWESGTRFKYIGSQADILEIKAGHIGMLSYPSSKLSTRVMITFDGVIEPIIVPTIDLVEIGFA